MDRPHGEPGSAPNASVLPATSALPQQDALANRSDSTAATQPTSDSGGGAAATAGATQPADSRRVVGYLLWPEADDYIAIMDVLEASVTDLAGADVAAALAAAGRELDVRTVELRLDMLTEAGAVSARSDTSRARRYVELLARNWRYTASPTGRQVHRFWRTVLAGTPTMREIPIASLNRVVTNLETLAVSLGTGPADSARVDAACVDAAGIAFTSHEANERSGLPCGG